MYKTKITNENSIFTVKNRFIEVNGYTMIYQPPLLDYVAMEVKNFILYPRGTKQNGFSGQFFHIFEINCCCFVPAIFDIVQDVDAIHGLW